jgi:hypothetical protein
MTLLRSSLALILLTPVLATVGCNDEGGVEIKRESVAQDIGDVVCEAYSSCECPLDAINSAEECATAIQPSLERAIVEGELYGLRYFSECLSKTEALMNALGCGSQFDESDENLQKLLFDASVCKLLAGDAGRGDPCLSVGGVSLTNLGDTCKHDLVCGGGVCVEWPDSKGDICHDIGVCPPGLGCIDPDADGVLTCETPADAGGDCNPHDFAAGCGPDLFCNPTSKSCAALPSAGSPCLAGTCASGNFCLLEICSVLPTAGQQCPQGVCADGLECDFTNNTCVALPGAGLPCSNGFGCAAGLVCGIAGTCEQPPAFVCSVPHDLGLCVYQSDGICDEPEGTGLCQEGTDPDDCGCPSENDGVCDEPEGTGLCNEGTDPTDCGSFCPTTNDGTCDEPEGSNTCAEGTDAADCGATCPTAGDGTCDEPEGTGLCDEGTDPIDCPADTCPSAGDGICDEPEGTGLCPEGTDPIDCPADTCPSVNDGICDEPEGTGLCPEGTDPIDCPDPGKCPYAGDGICDEPEGTGICPEGTDPKDCG